MSVLFSLSTSNHLGRSANGSSEFSLSSLFLFWFWVSGNGTNLLDASWSLRSKTELEDELEDELQASCTSFLDAMSASLLNESCDGDVEDETLSELVDDPVLQIKLFPTLVNRGF